MPSPLQALHSTLEMRINIADPPARFEIVMQRQLKMNTEKRDALRAAKPHAPPSN
ncbi:MAG TPA: hypothetical protein VGD60_10710 [Candidatus Acidoferrales bacterium]